MQPAETGFVTSQTINGICTITFFHPQGNSLPSILLHELTTAFKWVSENPLAKVVVLKSQGNGAFCAGASFNELAAITTKAAAIAFFSGFAHLINAMRTCRKLIIGRIHGKCVGGGVGLVAACDHAIATVDAAVKLSELSMGIGPFVIGPAVALKIGRAAFNQLAIDAFNWRSSHWAMEKGLFAAVYENNLLLDNAVDSLAQKIAATSQAATEAVKQMCWHGTEHWEELLLQNAAISAELILSPFTREAISAIKNKKN